MSTSFCQASSPAGLSGPAASPPYVAQILTSYTTLSEVSPDERPSQLLHVVARATDARPVQVYNALQRAGKLRPRGETAQDAPKQVKNLPQSPIVPDARPFAPDRIIALLSLLPWRQLLAPMARLPWRRLLNPLFLLLWSMAWRLCLLLEAPAYVEDAARRHSLRPYPAPVAAPTADAENDISWLL